MHHVPMCKMCEEFEVGTFQAWLDFCSDACADKAHEYQYDAAGDGWGYDDIVAVFDDDPSPYAGTYSEE
jgi:hypothetical protein